jgi:hypothetical protein
MDGAGNGETQIKEGFYISSIRYAFRTQCWTLQSERAGSEAATELMFQDYEARLATEGHHICDVAKRFRTPT